MPEFILSHVLSNDAFKLIQEACNKENIKVTDSQLDSAAYTVENLFASFVQKNKDFDCEIAFSVSAYDSVVKDRKEFHMIQMHMYLKQECVLKYICNERYLFKVGKRGAVTLVMYPDSLKRFKGKKFCGYSVQ